MRTQLAELRPVGGVGRAATVALVLCLVAGAFAQVSGVTKKETKTKTIPFETEYQFSRTLGAGRTKLQTKGKSGKIVTTYSVTRSNGKVVSKVPLYSTKTPSQNEVMLIGQGGYQASRGSFSSRNVMTMVATGYEPFNCGGDGRGLTATGIKARFGVIAVDPRVIPLGTLVYVEGYGLALAADTGGAIKGKKIDLCFNTEAEAIRWGRRPVRVHVLGKQ